MHSHALIFIQDMAIIMLIAGLATVLCHLFRQPIVIGYILAGVIIGKHTPPFSFIADETTIKTLAELGVIFLMFSLGLEFNLHKLSKVGTTAVISAVLEILLMIWLGYEIGILFGWTTINAIFLGAILAISSTTIIVKALTELKMKNEPFTQIIFGILIIEDIFAILILALLSSIAITGSLQITDIIYASTKLVSFMVVAMLLGFLLVPRLLSFIAKFKSNEMLLISVLGLCFGFCLIVVKLNYSIALGAFIIGAIIAESNQLKKIEYLINPLRDMFSAIFFVSVGLLFNPNVIVDYFYPVFVITVVVILGKIISCSLGVLISGHDGKTSMRVGMGLAQIGEFSFIIAALGITLKVTESYLYSIAVCVSVITTLTTPYLIKHSDACARFTGMLIPKNLSSTFAIYAGWMQRKPAIGDQLRFMVKRSIIQIIINIFIALAIFIFAVYFAKTAIMLNAGNIIGATAMKSAVFTIALLLSMPFLIAAYQKIKALSMLTAEALITENGSSKLTSEIRNMISEVMPIMIFLLIILLIAFLSESIIPPLPLLVLILLVIGILTLFVLPWLVRLHAKLQIKLIKSLKNRRGK
jgi:CPA2 family monovalent cation:H+ antiporter-2